MTAAAEPRRAPQSRRVHLRPTPHEEAVLDLYGVSPLGWEAFPTSGLLVGEAPGPRTHAELPLLPCPAGSAGGRLMAMSGLQPAEYLGRLARANLLEQLGPWRAGAARHLALVDFRLVEDLPSRAVLLGRRVLDAFEPGRPFYDPFVLEHVRWYVGVPHPSGRARAYNDPACRERTRRVLRWAAGLEDLAALTEVLG